jgi:hypothetical protein
MKALLFYQHKLVWNKANSGLKFLNTSELINTRGKEMYSVMWGHLQFSERKAFMVAYKWLMAFILS